MAIISVTALLLVLAAEVDELYPSPAALVPPLDASGTPAAQPAYLEAPTGADAGAAPRSKQPVPRLVEGSVTGAPRAQAAASMQGNGAPPPPGGPPHYTCGTREKLPPVTIATATRGQRHLESNIWLNVRYSRYPPSLLELILIDSSSEPSAFFSALSKRKDNTSPRVVYVHTGVPEKRYHDMWVGNARNRMTQLASADIIVNMDDDDIYPPNYVHHMVSLLTRAEPRTGHVIQDTHRRLVVHPGGTWRISPVEKSPKLGGHHMAFNKTSVANCAFQPTGSAEELSFFRCTEARGLRRYETPPLRAAMIKVRNPLSITMQLFYMHRGLVTPLNRTDWVRFTAASQRVYKLIHEMLRPACIEPDESTPTGLTDRAPGSILDLPLSQSAKAWREHMKESLVPCEGFSRLPGQTIKKRLDVEVRVYDNVSSAVRCCNLCSVRASCTVYEYTYSSKSCKLASRGADRKNKGIGLVNLESGSVLKQSTAVRDIDNPRSAKKENW